MGVRRNAPFMSYAATTVPFLSAAMLSWVMTEIGFTVGLKLSPIVSGSLRLLSNTRRILSLSNVPSALYFSLWNIYTLIICLRSSVGMCWGRVGSSTPGCSRLSISASMAFSMAWRRSLFCNAALRLVFIANTLKGFVPMCSAVSERFETNALTSSFHLFGLGSCSNGSGRCVCRAERGGSTDASLLKSMSVALSRSCCCWRAPDAACPSPSEWRVGAWVWLMASHAVLERGTWSVAAPSERVGALVAIAGCCEGCCKRWIGAFEAGVGAGIGSACGVCCARGLRDRNRVFRFHTAGQPRRGSNFRFEVTVFKRGL